MQDSVDYNLDDITVEIEWDIAEEITEVKLNGTDLDEGEDDEYFVDVDNDELIIYEDVITEEAEEGDESLTAEVDFDIGSDSFEINVDEVDVDNAGDLEDALGHDFISTIIVAANLDLTDTGHDFIEDTGWDGVDTKVQIDRGVTIKAEADEEITLNINGVIAFSSDELIRLEGFTIDDEGDNASIELTGDQNEVVDNTFDTKPNNVVISIRSDGNLIKGNEIKGEAVGTTGLESAIIVRDKAFEELENGLELEITGNTVTNNDIALMFQQDDTIEEADITVEGNDFETDKEIKLNETTVNANVMTVRADDLSSPKDQEDLLNKIFDDGDGNTFNEGAEVLEGNDTPFLIGVVVD